MRTWLCLVLIWLPAAASDSDQKIATYSKAVAGRPRESHLQNQLALAYLHKMRETVDFSYLDKASALVEGVLAGDPGNYEALRLRAEVQMERHEFVQVAEYAEELTRFAPDDPANWGTLGDASMELGRYQVAGAAYTKMLSLRPDLASYNRMAWFQFVHGRVPEAIENLRNAIAAGSSKPANLAWCWNDLGNIYLKTGHIAEAEISFAAALSAFPGYYPAYAGLGRARAAQGRWRDAIEAFQHAQATVPMPEFAAALEDVYRAAGNLTQSRKERDLLDAIDKMNRATGERTNRTLALLFADHDRNLERAASLVENEVQVRPDVYTYDALAWVRYQQKRYPEAEAAAAQALALETPEPAFWYHAGLIAKALGKAEESARLLGRAKACNTALNLCLLH